MAQATILNIGKSNTNPASAGTAEISARKLKFASAFQDMDGDLTDVLVQARLVSLCIEARLSGTRDNIQTDEAGGRWMVIGLDDVEMISFAGLELCDRIKSLHEAYQNVFAITEIS